MEETIIYKGMWWLPENSTNKVSGILTVKKSQIVLEIIGDLCNESIFDFVNSEGHNKKYIIWGISSENKSISIFGNFSNMIQNSSCSFPLMTFNVQYAIIGGYIESLDKKEFYEVKAKIEELSYWFRPNCIKDIIETDEGVSFSVQKNECDKISVPLRNGCDLQLEGESKTSYLGSGMSVHIEQWSVLIFSFNHPISIMDAKKMLFQFEQFLSLATLSCVQYSHCWLKNRNTDERFELFEKGSDVGINKRFQDYLFDYEVIKESFPKVIKNWFDNENLSPIRKHLIDSITTKGYFEANDFLIVCQAIEGFYCRFKKNKEDFRIIFQNLIQEFSDIKKLDFNVNDISYIKDSRNHFSHLLPPGDKNNVLDGMDLFFINHKLRKLLICCILKLIGFSNEEINRIFDKCNNFYLEEIG